MPTGYTAYIEDGDITTGKEFLKLCTRAFGIAIDLKDKPLSVPTKTHYEPSPYYKEDYEETAKVRDKMRQLTFEEAKQQIIEKYNEDITHAKKCLDMYKSEDEKYLKVRNEVDSWIPPTSEHEELKKFALNQIDISMNTDYCKYCEEELNKELDISDDAVWKYINDINEFYEKDTERAYQRWQEELKRVADKNKWMKQFLNSLENIDDTK